jgi:(p)ppGpp synthase/HD superfamily hydrolase
MRASSRSGAHRTQLRKYTGEPYFVHLDEVAKLCARHGCNKHTVAAAYLHDTIEDQNVSYDDIHGLFGREVADLVWALTDEATVHGGPNREQRKKLDRERLALAPADAQSIKCADLISNTSSIARHDKNFARTYLPEKRATLTVLTRAKPRLLELAWTRLKEAEALLDA